LAEIRHPAIVEYVTHGQTEGGAHFLATEWLDGVTLATLIARRKVSLEEFVAIASAIVDAVSVLHDRDVIHRDLKPANLFLVDGRLDRVKLLDLGLARTVIGGGQFTSTGVVMGTLSYMSPEQARGQRTLDVRTDIYSLGVIFFECLAGRRFVTRDDPLTMIQRIVFEHAPNLADERPDLPSTLCDLVGRMLAKSKEHRPGSAASLIEALSTIAAERATSGVDDVPPFESAARAQPDTRHRLTIEALADSDATLPNAEGTRTDPIADVAAIARAHGAHLELRANGSGVIAGAERRGQASQAIDLARIALAVQLAHPELALSLTAAPPSASHAVSLSCDRSSIVIDPHLQPILNCRFEVTAHGDDFHLCREIFDPTTAWETDAPRPFVGREMELRAVRSRIESVRRDRAACRLDIVGPPGIGKARLVAESLRSGPTSIEGAVVLWSTAAPDDGSPFALLRSLLINGAHLHPGEPPLVHCRKLERFVSETAGLPPHESRRIAARIGETVGLPWLEGRAKRASLVSSILPAAAEWIAACAARGILIWIVARVDAADAASRQLLENALAVLRDEPMLVITTAQSGRVEAVPGERNDCLRLGPLTEAEARQMIAAHAPGKLACSDTLVAQSGCAPGALITLLRGRDEDASTTVRDE
jgi:hypothetical protein